MQWKETWFYAWNADFNVLWMHTKVTDGIEHSFEFSFCDWNLIQIWATTGGNLDNVTQKS